MVRVPSRRAEIRRAKIFISCVLRLVPPKYLYSARTKPQALRPSFFVKLEDTRVTTDVGLGHVDPSPASSSESLDE